MAATVASQPQTLLSNGNNSSGAHTLHSNMDSASGSSNGHSIQQLSPSVIPGLSGSGFVSESDPDVPVTNSADAPFRSLIPSPTHPRIAGICNHTALSWCESRRKIPEPAWLINRLDQKNLETPWKGFTSDGQLEEGVYNFEQVEDGAPTEEMVEKANQLLAQLDEQQLKEVQKGSPEDDNEIRIWSNPELYINPGGLRLDECSSNVQNAVHELLKASTSPEGYRKINGCCLTNEFLGKLVNGPQVLGRHSYNFRLFGKPSLTEPWGFTFFGHHLCLCIVVVGKSMVIGPTFQGAEPDRIDEGPDEGLRLFQNEEERGLRLMQSLTPELQERAQVSKSMKGEDLPEGAWNPFDERHLGGAQQDNRVVPYTGCPISQFNTAQKAAVVELASAFLAFYPSGPLQSRLKQIESTLDQCYFVWMGGFGNEEAYYFRIHGPNVWCEFDFHCGIFLTNTSPAKCHIHTITRLPNGGDYGRALIKQSKVKAVDS